MTNLVGNGSGLTESFKGFVCGLVYGVTSPLIGHPLDTIKTRMQAGTQSSGSAWSLARQMVKAEGFLSLYRGLLPPLFGSSLFRSIQFSAYGLAMGSQQGTATHTVIPGTMGLEVRVLTSGLFASFCRSLLETPLEYIKVRQQMAMRVTGEATAGMTIGSLASNPAVLRAEVDRMFTGFGVSFLRTWGLMGTFFIFVSHLERHHADLLAVPLLGPFVKGGVCATLSWILVWPFEVIKNQVQAGTPGMPKEASLRQRMAWVVKNRGGVLGLYRGIGPGVTRSLLANGSSMVMYAKCKEALFQ